jgi:ABC-type polysaccharide/polyol phosphate transport system ATPase subunit
MASLVLSNVHVEIPIFTSRSVGLINTIFSYARWERKQIESVSPFSFIVHALSGVTLDIREGDRVALIGRNGAGKTTLLRVLSGAYEPTDGTIFRSGSTTALTNITLGMDMDADGFDNIRMRAIQMNLSRSEEQAFRDDVVAFAELGEHLALPVRTYSSGMLLRLAFALSVFATPEILLMDEMISAGDVKFVKKAHARLTQLMDRAKILVLASHHENILHQFCNRGIYLREGQVVFDGHLSDCLREYNADESNA